ncbi:MAG: hypothetical protein MJE77_32960 [Proteobacteria bacterium]|nr:hypothetical protein [Pseudomonadota bacterium]
MSDSTSSVLSDDRLFSGSLPASWQHVVDLISEFDTLASNKPGNAGKVADRRVTEARRQRAAILRERIIDEARKCHEHAPARLRTGSAEHKRWFTEAALLWLFFAESCGKVRLDTLGSETLGRFPVDLDPDDEVRGQVRAALCRAFGWSRHQLGEIEDRQQHLISNLRVKGAITAELCRIIGAPTRGVAAGAAGHSAVLAQVAQLMSRVYGGSDDLIWRPGDVDLVITTTSIFFCLPILHGKLSTADYPARKAGERRAVERFIERMQKASMSAKNVRFPAFGLFDRDAVDAGLLRQLTVAVRRTPGLERVDDRVVAQSFATMVVLIPSSEAEKYLIHDSWGHGWQESLCEFEWLFHDFDELGEPLSAAALAPAFGVEGGKTVVEAKKLLSIAQDDLRRRITIGLNLVVAECLADLMEHKFSRYREALPTSSLLPEAPLKMDLSLIDCKRIRRLWSRPYRRLAENSEARRALADQLSQQGVDAIGLHQAIAAAVQYIVDNLGSVLSLGESEAGAGQAHAGVIGGGPAGEARAQEQTIPVDIVQRIVLGVATFDAALDRFLVRGDERYSDMCARRGPDIPRWRCPAACIDLVVLVLAWFYEQDRSVNIWHLDELLENELWPSLVAFERALNGD